VGARRWRLKPRLSAPAGATKPACAGWDVGYG
jgi:hypothetical protein